jgi:hypothetical protein
VIGDSEQVTDKRAGDAGGAGDAEGEYLFFAFPIPYSLFPVLTDNFFNKSYIGK